MKKKHRHHPKRVKPARPRNAATGAAPAAPRARARSITRATPPDWKTIAAAVAGGAGSAALGGLVVNQQILSPEAVGIGLMLGGGATAYFSDGTPRIVGTSIAAAGAGQFALALMNKRALKAHGQANASAPPPAQLPAPPPVARQSADAGGSVVDMFRDAANDLDLVEDEWRYGTRDAGEGGEPIVIDLDEAA
ncbi:MAG: hypothetical protein QM831_21420 [Kofleriaceae bacterium]